MIWASEKRRQGIGTAAFLGTLLDIKPVLKVDDEEAHTDVKG